MKPIYTYLIILFSGLFLLSGTASTATLPDNLQWITNDEDPVFASPDAPRALEYSFLLLEIIASVVVYFLINSQKFIAIQKHAE